MWWLTNHSKTRHWIQIYTPYVNLNVSLSSLITSIIKPNNFWFHFQLISKTIHVTDITK